MCEFSDDDDVSLDFEEPEKMNKIQYKIHTILETNEEGSSTYK